MMGLFTRYHTILVKYLTLKSLEQKDVDTFEEIERLKETAVALEQEKDTLVGRLDSSTECQGRIAQCTAQLSASQRVTSSGRTPRIPAKLMDQLSIVDSAAEAGARAASSDHTKEYLDKRMEEEQAASEELSKAVQANEQETAAIAAEIETMEDTWAEGLGDYVKALVKIERKLNVAPLEFHGHSWNGPASKKILNTRENIWEEILAYHESTSAQQALRAELDGLRRNLAPHYLDSDDLDAAEVGRLEGEIGAFAAGLEPIAEVWDSLKEILNIALAARELAKTEIEGDLPAAATRLREANEALGVRSVSPKLYLAVVEFLRFAENWGTIGLVSECGIEVYHKFINRLETAYLNMANDNARDKAMMSRIQAFQNLEVQAEAEACAARRAHKPKPEEGWL